MNEEIAKKCCTDINKYLELQTNEIIRLNNIIKIKTEFIEDLLQMIYESLDSTLHTKCHLTGLEYEDKLEALKENK